MLKMANSVNSFCVNMMSYSMHGFHQGCPTLDDMIEQYNPDVFLLQEHWLTPTNLYKFDQHFADYFSFGSSAMSSTVAAGMLRGRPFGGVIALIKNNLRKLTKTIHCDDRYVIIPIGDCIFVNVYLPCAGSSNRQLICENTLAEIWAWCQPHEGSKVIIAGDFNVDLDSADTVARSINRFAHNCLLSRCDELFPNAKCSTYVNTALNQQSHIDYILASSSCIITNFLVIDPDINFSDHLPLFATVTCNVLPSTYKRVCNSGTHHCPQYQLRWDRGDLASYYYHTGDLLAPLLSRVELTLTKSYDTSNDCTLKLIDDLYNDIVAVLASCAKSSIPEHRKCFYKFWWNEELKILKEASVESNNIWKAAGKPHQGAIFDKRQSSRLQYRRCTREHQKSNDEHYTNELHNALLQKNGKTFWKCWRSKFECCNNVTQVDSSVDADVIVGKFAEYFANIYTCNNERESERLKEEYLKLRTNYSGLPLSNDIAFDTELVSKIITELKRGKAADIDGLTAEHLLFSHPILPVLLSKLFQLIISSRYIPSGFKYSYIVPIPKPKDCHNKVMKCDDFRGIAISPVISKVLEYCFLEKFQSLITTNDNQFGFKKGIGCHHAIYTARNIVNRFVNAGSTINLCAIDLSKAFDKVNHKALYIKLMKRGIPERLLELLENLFSNCYSCVKWNNVWSSVFDIAFGVRQGSVLSPFLFALYLDDLAKLCDAKNGCFIILYADDILLISPSVVYLEQLLHACERELHWLDMAINFDKSCCLRVGPRNNIACAAIISLSGRVLYTLGC